MSEGSKGQRLKTRFKIHVRTGEIADLKHPSSASERRTGGRSANAETQWERGYWVGKSI